MAQVIALGAEAQISKDSYLDKETVVKNRLKKKYRNNILDSTIIKSRTKQEALLLHHAKLAGVNTPIVYKTNRKGTIVMEHINGKLLREDLGKENYKDICREIGSGIAKIHGAGIVHGDLTTSNLIMRDKELFFIDFGLGFFSKKQEDFAVDLLNFKKTYSATHFNLLEGWEIITNAYTKEFLQGKEVVAKIEEIEKRARYL